MNTTTFEVLGVSKGLCKILSEAGYEVPTDIQALALPPLFSGQDLVGIAPTGTGKTLAYLLPIFQALRSGKLNSSKGPIALVVTPSRELAAQVAEVAQLLTAGDEELRIACVYGGTGTVAQKKLLEAKPALVVGTPGRIREFYLSEELILKQVKFLVLDEADRLMDMGFMPQLRAMLEVLPRKRQNLLFSATFNTRVEAASAEFLEWPVKVQAAKQATVPVTITEHFVRTPNQATKRNLLLHLIKESGPEGSGFVFCRSRQEANQVEAYLAGTQVASEVLHANKGQNTRQRTLDDFKEGRTRWLVTTDVSSRGLDVAGVPIVIQTGLPLDVRDYVHRTGRTGRAGQAGTSYLMIDPGDEARLSNLAKLLGRKIELADVPAEVEVPDTPKLETIEYERSIDEIKRAADPTFKGAFHEKKEIRVRPKPSAPKNKTSKASPSKPRKRR